MVRGRRHGALGVGLAVIAVACIGLSAQPLLATGATTPSSTASLPSGVTYSLVTPAQAAQPSVSGNGERVVFAAAPGTADGRTSSIWLQDRNTGVLTELTLPNANVRSGDSVDPVISADGCIVVMTTQIAYDLFRDDDRGNRWDVYRMKLPACGGQLNDWSLVSTQLDKKGVAAARGDVIPTQPAAVSSSGTVVAYLHPMTITDSIASATQRPNVIEVVDLAVPVDDPHHTATAPGLPIDVALPPLQYAGEATPTLSADGSIVVFASDAKSEMAVPEWRAAAAGSTVAPSQIYSWSRADGDPFTAVKLLSGTSLTVTDSTNPNAVPVTTTTPADAAAVGPTISGDGRFVAFSSTASNLVDSAQLEACAATCPSQVYVIDRDTDSNQIFDQPGTAKISIVSATYAAPDPAVPATTPGFTIGNAASFSPSISSDGNTLVFASQATNLLETTTPGGGVAGDGDVLTANVITHHLHRSFDLATPTAGAYSHPRLSADNRVLVADTSVAGPLLGDTTLTGRHIVAASYVPALSMADLDLGTVLLKVAGPEWFVNVVNSGPGTFLPATVTSSNPDFAISGGTCLDHAPVPAGQICSVMVVLTPSVAGPLTSTMTVAEAGFGAITLTAHLTGAGGDPALLAKPTAAAFGSVVVGQPAPNPLTFDITNIYVQPLAVSAVSVGGANAADFTVDASVCRAATAIQTTVVQVPVAAASNTAPSNTAPPTTAPPRSAPTPTTVAPPSSPTPVSPTTPSAGAATQPPTPSVTPPSADTAGQLAGGTTAGSTASTAPTSTVPTPTVPTSTVPTSTAVPVATAPTPTVPASTVPTSSVPTSTVAAPTVPTLTVPASTAPISTVPISTVPTSTAVPVSTVPASSTPVTTPATTPAAPPPATVLPTAASTTKTVTSIVPGIAPNTSCPITVTFTPTASGIRTASINIGSSAAQYTSMLVSGTGVYTPAFIAPATATPGRDLVVGGSGYPVKTDLTLGWSDGSGDPMTVTTDQFGKFVAHFPVDLGQRPGPTTLIARAPDGSRASVTVDVDRVRRQTPAVPGRRG